MPVTEAQVLEALRAVHDPDLHRDIVSLGFVKDVAIEGGAVSFTIELTTPACPVRELLQDQAEEAVSALPGVESVKVEMTARVRERQTNPEDLLPEVRHVIAIASGKGGVGKSTVTVNLAVALSASGAKVGILDADVYGPSIPMMVGAGNEKPYTKGNKIIPIERFGLKLMSIGFLLEEGQAVLWRGPMVAGTVKQLLEDVAWGDLDYLLVDLPPGTGDAPMSLAQLAPLTGVVIVTTPHNVAANIAGKSVQLFRRLKSPILGVIENMAAFVDPETGRETRIFSGMSGQDLANDLRVPYLGSLPLDPGISSAADQGVPSFVAFPGSRQAQSFGEIAGRLAQECSIRALNPEADPAAV
ncbi:MAG TPA: Mrp/NBP35 family ATP-binding protein [Fimbriimonadaceae bacterium]|nr:Mrp/NBP35 family ATP-binding protein [Fimbriimonadaceae bacterium]